ncbi:hypothetical protein [Streptomyces sp. NPDC057623]|uniref:hypothetical protein n=1 Tax=Streptomyces sp. NPDC057623 TaxID=3346187 RepID=UPI0036AE7C39
MESLPYVVEYGGIDVSRMPAEGAVSHCIDYARDLCPRGRVEESFRELRETERASPQLVRNNPRVRETFRDLRKQPPVTGGSHSAGLLAMAQRRRAVQ